VERFTILRVILALRSAVSSLYIWNNWKFGTIETDLKQIETN
jgi:hypothetical protein